MTDPGVCFLVGLFGGFLFGYMLGVALFSFRQPQAKRPELPYTLTTASLSPEPEEPEEEAKVEVEAEWERPADWWKK